MEFGFGSSALRARQAVSLPCLASCWRAGMAGLSASEMCLAACAAKPAGAGACASRRRPEQTVLYQTLAAHWPAFRERMAESGGLRHGFHSLSQLYR